MVISKDLNTSRNFPKTFRGTFRPFWGLFSVPLTLILKAPKSIPVFFPMFSSNFFRDLKAFNFLAIIADKFVIELMLFLILEVWLSEASSVYVELFSILSLNTLGNLISKHWMKFGSLSKFSTGKKVTRNFLWRLELPLSLRGKWRGFLGPAIFVRSAKHDKTFSGSFTGHFSSPRSFRVFWKARFSFSLFSLLTRKSHCGGQSMLTRRFETGEIGKRKPLSRARVHLASPLEGVYEFINVLLKWKECFISSVTGNEFRHHFLCYRWTEKNDK